MMKLLSLYVCMYEFEDLDFRNDSAVISERTDFSMYIIGIYGSKYLYKTLHEKFNLGLK